MKMPKKAAKAAGGPVTKEKANAGKHKPTGVNKPAVKESIPQVVAKTTFGDIKPRQKM